MSANFKRHISRNRIFLVSKTASTLLVRLPSSCQLFGNPFYGSDQRKVREKVLKRRGSFEKFFKIRISLLDQSQNLSSDRSFCSGSGGCIFIQMLLCSERRLMDQKCQTEACRFFSQFSYIHASFILYLSPLKGADFQILFDGSQIFKNINQVDIEVAYT